MKAEHRKEIDIELLRRISSARSLGDPNNPDYEEIPDQNITPFLFGASQVTLDLAMAAQCEADGILDSDDKEFFDLFRSPLYWTARETFVRDAADGNTYAMLFLVWRAYNAGRLSPNRLEPSPRRKQDSERQVSPDPAITEANSSPANKYRLDLSSKELWHLLNMLLVERDLEYPIAGTSAGKHRTHILAERMRQLTNEEDHVALWDKFNAE